MRESVIPQCACPFSARHELPSSLSRRWHNPRMGHHTASTSPPRDLAHIAADHRTHIADTAPTGHPAKAEG